MKPGWNRFRAMRQSFPHVDDPPWYVFDMDTMETVPGLGEMAKEQARAKARELEEGQSK